MGIAQSSSTTLYIGKSATENSEPANYQTIKATGHSTAPSAGEFSDEFLDPSGKAADSFRHSKAGGGDVSSHWLPADFDGMVESALQGDFSAAFTASITASFSAITGANIQTIDDDGTTGVLAGLTAGDLILITNAVDAGNNGLKRVVTVPTADQITVYNSTGVVAAADAVDIDNAGTATLGTTKSFQWLERVLSDGVNDIYSEWYSDLIVASWQLSFQSAAPTRTSFNLQGDSPTFNPANGSPPITPLRNSGVPADVAATSERLVHGMNDVREIVVYSPTLGSISLCSLVSQFDFTVQRAIQQDTALCTDEIINTAAGRPTLRGTLNAYVTAEALSTPALAQQFLDNPDDLEMHITFGATEATSYCAYFDTLRFGPPQAPTQGNDTSVQFNNTISATDIRLTRI